MKKARLLALLCAALLAAGCSFGRYHVEYDYREARGPYRSFTAQEAELIRAGYEAAPGLMVEYVLSELNGSAHESGRILGRALARLPDLADGITPREARAARVLLELHRGGGPGVRAALEAAARGPGAAYSSALQSLFWMARKMSPAELAGRDLSPSALVDYGYKLLPTMLETPAGVLDYLARDYSYVLDRSGAAARRREFFRRKYGDCTEFTQLAGWLVSLRGYECQVLFCAPTLAGGHTALVYRDADGYWLLDASRAAAARILKSRPPGTLGPIDHVFLNEMADFDRLRGPTASPGQAVRFYGEDVPYTLVPFTRYDRYIQVHGREAARWGAEIN